MWASMVVDISIFKRWNYPICIVSLISKQSIVIQIHSKWNPKYVTFLSKIRNHISEKNGKKIVLLHGIWIQNFKVVVFPSNFWIQNFKVVIFPPKFLNSKFQGNGFSFEFLKYKRNLTNFYSDFESCSGMLLPQK